jgi:hypothetical protein
MSQIVADAPFGMYLTLEWSLQLGRDLSYPHGLEFIPTPFSADWKGH